MGALGWALLVTVGGRPEPVVSSVYAFAEEYGPPVHVHLFPSRATEALVPVVGAAVKALLGEVEVEHTVVDETDIEACFRAVAGVVGEMKGRGLSVAVDVTPGRKTMSVAAYKAAVEGGADLVLYLHLRCPEYEGEIYPFIPRHCARLVRLWGGGSAGEG